MTAPRSRRTARAAATRRSTGRPLARAASRPLPAGDRAGAPRWSARGAARPGGRSVVRTAAAAAAARRPLVTGRAVVLVGLVLLLALTLAGPVRGFLAGRAQIAQLAAQGQAQEQRIAQLRAELRRQDDPAYVARQARERLTYVLPGDRLVIVDGATPGGTAGAARSTTAPARPAVPWYDGLMQSVATADGAAKAGR